MEPHKDDSNLRFTDVLEIPVGRDLELGALIGPRGSAVELASDFVVYFPGLGSSKEYFQPCLLSPKLQRFTGLALDSLGIGHSALPRPDDQSYRIQEQATLVNELLDTLVDRGLCRSITIVAHSWGEAIALAALQQKNRQIHRYVSVAGGVTGGPIDSPETYLSADFLDSMLPLMALQMAPISATPSPRERTLVRRILVDCIDSFLKEKDALEDIFRTLSCPSYFIRGAQDICPGIDGFTEKIVIPQAGHDVIHEAPSCFNSQLSRILGP